MKEKVHGVVDWSKFGYFLKRERVRIHNSKEEERGEAFDELQADEKTCNTQ